jgi:hypothetical protein
MCKYLLGIVLVVVRPAALPGQSVNPGDLAGEWVFAHTLYGETGHARMTLKTIVEHVTVALWDMSLEGGIHDGKIEVKRSGNEKPVMRMTGTVRRDRMEGEFTVGELNGNWKATRIPVRPSDAPREYKFEPNEFHRVFSGAIPPVLHIYPGDSLKTWSVDAGGVDAKGIRRSLGGNPLTGPFYVEGALPGDTLVVKLSRIRLNRDTAISSVASCPARSCPTMPWTRSRWKTTTALGC